jgi:hypothetical protein
VVNVVGAPKSEVVANASAIARAQTALSHRKFGERLESLTDIWQQRRA